MALLFDGVDIIVEMSTSAPNVAAVWVDITSSVRAVPSMALSSRSAQTEIHAPGRMTIVLDGRTRLFDPLNASSSWFGLLKSMQRKIQVRTTTPVAATLWHGLVQSITQDRNLSNKDATTTFQCVDLLALLAMTRQPESAWAVEVAKDGPWAWWRLGDKQDQTMTDSSLSSRHGQYDGIGVGNTVTGLIYGSSNDAIVMNSQTSGRYTGQVLTANDITVECWLRLPDFNVGTDQSAFLVWCGEDGAGLQYGNTIAVGSTPAQGFLFANWRSVSGYCFRTWRVPVLVGVHHVVTTRSLGVLRMFLDGVELTDVGANNGAGTGLFSSEALVFRPTIQILRHIVNGGFPTVTMDEVAIYTFLALSPARVLAHFQAGVKPALNKPGDHLGRILALTPAVLTSAIDPGHFTTQPPTTSGWLLGNAQDITRTAAGRLFQDSAGTVTFHESQRDLLATKAKVRQATFGDGGGTELPYMSVILDDTDPFTITRWTGQRNGGNLIDIATVAPIERTLQSGTLLHVTDQDVRDLGAHQLLQNGTSQVRVTSLVVNARTTATGLWAKILTLTIGDRIGVLARPVNVGVTIDTDQIIEGVEHSIGPMEWTTTYHCLPIPPGVTGGPAFYDGTGVYDTASYIY